VHYFDEETLETNLENDTANSQRSDVSNAKIRVTFEQDCNNKEAVITPTTNDVTSPAGSIPVASFTMLT
jgi:hypothetical protein